MEQNRVTEVKQNHQSNNKHSIRILHFYQTAGFFRTEKTISQTFYREA